MFLFCFLFFNIGVIGHTTNVNRADTLMKKARCHRNRIMHYYIDCKPLNLASTCEFVSGISDAISMFD